MRCLKVGFVPAKADPDKQEDFKKKELAPRLEEAKARKRAVFFVDAAHFVLGAFLGWVWCFKRLFIKSPSGRQRLNVLGLQKISTKWTSRISGSRVGIKDLSWGWRSILSKISSGAMKAITHELIAVTNETYINAESVCELLRKIAALNLGIPITIVLDNAKYQT